MSYVPRRPGLAIAAGVLLIIYGSLGLANSFCGAGVMLMQDMFEQPGEEALFPAPVDPRVAKEAPSAVAVESAALGLAFFISIAAIVAGIGILQLKSSARLLALILAALDILITLGHATYKIALTIPIEMRLLNEEAKNQPEELPFDIFGFIEGATWGSLAFGVVFTLVFWIVVLAMLHHKTVRAAFADVIEPEQSPRSKRRSQERYDDEFDVPPPKRSDETGIKDHP